MREEAAARRDVLMLLAAWEDACTAACVYQDVPDDPAIRVCVTHDPEFGLYGDEACARQVLPVSAQLVKAGDKLANALSLAVLGVELAGRPGLLDGQSASRRIATREREG